MLFASMGSGSAELTVDDLRQVLERALRMISEKKGHHMKVLIIPPDFTRFHSRAGELTEMAWEILGSQVSCVLPALGTHFPMTEEEKNSMFGALPHELIQDHDWQNGLVELGRISGDVLKELSDGKVDYNWPVQVNKILVETDWDLILSIGQVVPHEVVGMANYTKNIIVGTGGKEGIDKSHFLGAVCGMENIMGEAVTPVRELFNRGASQFCSHLPIVYVQTVISVDDKGNTKTRGIFIGEDDECYMKAAELARDVNIVKLEKAPAKVVVYLDPSEFRSTWLGNKSIYRTRKAIANGGELIVLAPGVHCFGENEFMDKIISKYGYKGTDYVLDCVNKYADMSENLSVAAHLIHGSSEGRFNITYCPGGLSREEVERAGFNFGDLDEYSEKYNIKSFNEGWNILSDGEEIFYISNPALGLWEAQL